jgi:hypothetical protein
MNITQTEKLEMAMGRFINPESVDLSPEDGDCVTVSTPPNGFKMPSRDAIRAHDARLMLHPCDTYAAHDDDDGNGDEEQDEESALRDAVLDKRRDAMREHSFRLPSQSSRREVSETLRSMGCTFHD